MTRRWTYHRSIRNKFEPTILERSSRLAFFRWKICPLLAEVFSRANGPYCFQGSTTKLASDLSIEEYEAVLSYVHEVSGQDRSRLLRLHFALDFIEGAVLMNSASRILAFASVTTTGAEDSHVFKISPVYAEGLDEALSVIRPLLNKIHEQV